MSARRKFLKGLAAASAGVLVADARISAIQQTTCADIWPEFKKKYKEKYPCVLVMEFSLLYHRQFLSITESKSRRLQSLFSQVPLIVMDRNQLQTHFKADDPGTNIFLVSLEGKILKKGKLAYADLGNSRRIAAYLDEFFYSDKVLQEAWNRFTPQGKSSKLEELLKIIDEGNFRERKKARLEISKEMKTHFWKVARCARTSGSIEQRESCRDLLIHYKGAVPFVSGVPCEINSQVQTRILCGMASMPKTSRNFVTGLCYA